MKNDFPRLDVSETLRRKMVEIARQFRKEPTRGVKFRRQQPIGPFVVDFYNSEYRLGIEVDGPIHEYQKHADQERQAILKMLGLHVLHINTELVENNLNTALEMLRAKLKELGTMDVSIPSPILGEGKGGGK